eukprot:COSAG01_NODE_58024_length_306_cov_1.717703_1_plen_90_part_01
MIDRLLAAGSDLLVYWTSVFQILLYSVQYSFRRILLLLLLKFHNRPGHSIRPPGQSAWCSACGPIQHLLRLSEVNAWHARIASHIARNMS